MAFSNALQSVFSTPDYIQDVRFSAFTVATITIDWVANIDSGTVHWAIWTDGTEPATSADIINAAGAVDNDSVTITVSGAQTAITGTVVESGVFWIVWVDGDESLLISVPFVAGDTPFYSTRRVVRVPRDMRSHKTPRIVRSYIV